MIRSAVAELEFISLATERASQDLMAHANAEDKFPADEIAHRFGGLLNIGRIARAIAKENTIGIVSADFIGRRARWKNAHFRGALAQLAERVFFATQINRRDLWTARIVTLDGFFDFA